MCPLANPLSPNLRRSVITRERRGLTARRVASAGYDWQIRAIFPARRHRAKRQTANLRCRNFSL